MDIFTLYVVEAYGFGGTVSRLLTAADAAKLALDQMIRRYRAVEAIAELTTAKLRALSR